MHVGHVEPDICWEQVVACTTSTAIVGLEPPLMRFVATSPSTPKVPHPETNGQIGCCASYAENVIEAFSQEPFELMYLVSVSSMLLKIILS
jgi:hypothetical protein